MPVLVNLRHLDAHNIQLEGELPVAELDIDTRDEVIQAKHPLKYDLDVQKMDDSLLIQGNLHLDLDCKCVRCLKEFTYPLELPNWALHLPLKGDDQVAVINDCVDLTPYIREDILLEFPRHPLCEADCRGLPGMSPGKGENAAAPKKTSGAAAWTELNKLKF